MSGEMVERVAKAQWELDCKSSDRAAWEDADNEHRLAAMELAHIAIKAMREPTEGMVDAGYDFTADPCWREDFIKAWQAMIDEALK